MRTRLFEILASFQFDLAEWRFLDFRIDIPPMSLGSDAINPHTQYSNPLAWVQHQGETGFGLSFTLGAGNDFVMEASRRLVEQLSGQTVGDLWESERGFYGEVTAINQIRWLSPLAGVPMMASGLIVNAVLDWASKRAGMPAWEFVARLDSSELLGMLGLEHLPAEEAEAIKINLQESSPLVDQRIEDLKKVALPVYYTTWIGYSAADISNQIWMQFNERGIRKFKLKIGPDIDAGSLKIAEIIRLSPPGTEFSVDANQSLSLDLAKQWIRRLSDLDVLWLEEPFAPDNVPLFHELIKFRDSEGLSCPIASGENCPNPHVAGNLLGSGLDIFQPDTCRMLGLTDNIGTAVLAKKSGAEFIPHAGGSGLDELARHTQLVNLARVDYQLDPLTSLTEHIGFASSIFADPTKVVDGCAAIPTVPGLGVGVSRRFEGELADRKNGETVWVRL